MGLSADTDDRKSVIGSQNLLQKKRVLNQIDFIDEKEGLKILFFSANNRAVDEKGVEGRRREGRADEDLVDVRCDDLPFFFGGIISVKDRFSGLNGFNDFFFGIK